MSDAQAKAKHDELMAATSREVEGSTDVPFALSELAFRRTKPLALEAQWRPISHIAADCYIQGLRDAAALRSPPHEEGGGRE